MSNKGKILIVDDEPFNCEIMEDILGHEYDLTVATGGQECLDVSEKAQPDLILLDISMPGMSGYEVCKQIKGNVKTKDIQITFVSALDTLADRLTGYEVGGDDYITKPFNAKELKRKVEVAFKNKELQRRLENNADEAMKTALTAITSTNEIGMVLQFLSATFHCMDYDSLAQLIVDTIAAFGYRSTVQIRAEGKETNKCSEAAINPLEVAVINRISGEDEHLDIGPRTIMNFKHLSILVKGMPINDEEEYSRVKENMSVIAEGAETRINAIEAQNALLGRAGLFEVMQHAHSVLNELNSRQGEQKQKWDSCMEQLSKSFAHQLQDANLEEPQVSTVLQLLENAQSEVLTNFQGEDELPADISNVIEELQSVINQ